MTTTEVLYLLPALVAGMILGVIFFGGLWLTVSRGLRSKKAALIFIGSFILRMAIILPGFYFVGGDNWQRMLASLAGFLIARTVITRITQKNKQSKQELIKEVSNETQS